MNSAPLDLFKCFLIVYKNSREAERRAKRSWNSIRKYDGNTRLEDSFELIIALRLFFYH